MRKGKLEKLAKVLENKIAWAESTMSFPISGTPGIMTALNSAACHQRNFWLIHTVFATLIRERILIHKAPNTNYRRSLSAIDDTANNGDWLKRSTLYSLMVRTSAAWDHDRSHSLDSCNFDNLKETGTFVKALALLPFLVKMGGYASTCCR